MLPSRRRLLAPRPEGDGEADNCDASQHQQQRRLLEPCHGRNGQGHGGAEKADAERYHVDAGEKGSNAEQ